MEPIIQSIPVVVSAILVLVLILTVITNIITEVLKKLCPRLPPNIVATLVAMVLTLCAFFAVCQIMLWPITWYTVAAAVVVGCFVAYAAMFGYDKLRQALEQIAILKSNK